MLSVPVAQQQPQMLLLQEMGGPHCHLCCSALRQSCFCQSGKIMVKHTLLSSYKTHLNLTS